MSIQRHFIWSGIALIVSLILASCQSSQPTPVPPTLTPTPSFTPAPTHTPTLTPTPTSPVPVQFLVDAENAIIQIEATGKFYTPKFGPVAGTPGRGSGFIIDPSGIAITSNQAVAGADQVQVRVGKDRGELRTAQVLGTSECANLALIDIEGEGFDFLSFLSAPIPADQKVYLAGYPLGGPEFVLDGVTIEKLLPIDQNTIGSGGPLFAYKSAVDPGLVGGPIISPDGKVTGVHLLGLDDGTQAFGIPLTEFQGSLEEFRSGQNVNSIGLNSYPVNSADGTLSGLWVYAVQPDSPASKAGIQGGDLITRIINKELIGETILSDYCDAIRDWKGDSPLSVQVYRENGDAVLAGEIGGKKLEVVSNMPVRGEPTPASGTPVTPNLRASKPGDVYYLEEFKEPLDSWSHFVLQGDETKTKAEIKDGKLVVTIDDIFTYLYYIFKPLKQVDVRLDIKAENLGRNNNNISLICRYSIDKGWYEFNIASNGLYWVKRFDPRLQNFVDIGKGASKYIKLGQGVNEYGAICKDNKLTLIINGNTIKTFTDNNLVTGQVGFSVSSFNVTPITVSLDYFKISVP